MASTGPTGGSAPFRVGARAAFASPPPRTGALFEFAPTGRAGAVVLASAVLSAGMLWLTAHSFAPVHSADWSRRAEAIGPVADRVAAGPVFLNPMRNRIPGHCPTPEDAR